MSIAPAAGIVIEAPKDYVRRPIYSVLRAPQPIAVDGVLDEPIWNRLAPITFVIYDGTGPAPMATEAKLCWDDTYLYVVFSCADRDLTSRITARDDYVCRDDAVEIFLNPSRDLAHYFEFEVNPRGVVWDGKDYNPRLIPDDTTVYDERWNAEGLLVSARFVGTPNDPTDVDVGWTVEMAIPFAALSARAPKDAESWRANLYRIDPGNPAQYYAWSPTQSAGQIPAFHVSPRFGRLVFSLRPG
jgi:hypothetical protein